MVGWKRPSRSSNQIINLTYWVPSLCHIPWCHIHSCLNYLQVWWLHHSPEHSVPTPYYPLFSITFVVKGSKLNTVLKVWSHQCYVQRNSLFSGSDSHTIDTGQNATGLFSHLGTLLAHAQLAINLNPQVLFS